MAVQCRQNLQNFAGTGLIALLLSLKRFLILPSHLAHVDGRASTCGLEVVSLQQQHLVKVAAEHLAAGQACHAAADNHGLQWTA